MVTKVTKKKRVKGRVAKSSPPSMEKPMSSMNEQINLIATAQSQAAFAVQELEKLYKEAEERVKSITANDEKAKKLAKEVAALETKKAELEEAVNKLNAIKAQALKDFGG
jgi:septal ring factor EnvC (AmiA/AmiB activator)